MRPHVAVIDLDIPKYHAAAAGEKRSVIITHPTTEDFFICDNRTQFYGHWIKKEGGILAEINKSRDSPFSWDEFTYEDVQIPDNLDRVLHSAEKLVEGLIKQSGAKDYVAYIGEGESFRVGLSTLKKYKGGRSAIKPVYIKEVSEYLEMVFNANKVTGIESDDAVVMDAYKDRRKFILTADKDAWGCPVNVYDPNQHHRGIVNCNKLGSLWVDDKGKVRGEGRLHLLWQVSSEDNVDNYAANCFSDIRWGAKSAYNSLKDCTTDKEAFEVVVGIFKHLYPEPRIVTGWRGEELEIDWLYVLNEMWTMARMLRWEGDSVHITEPLNNLGIKY